MRILVACPMQSEYQNFKNALSKFSPKHNYSVCCVGVGKVESTMEVTHRLSKSEYDLVVVIGYAAATNNFNLGDLVIPSKCRYSDVNVPDELEEVKPLTQTYHLSDLDDLTIYTADSFITHEGVLTLRKKFGFREAIFDMESTAVAQVASAWNTEMLVLKMVSDLPENDTISDFNKFVEEHSDFTPFVAYLEMLAS